MDTTHADHLSCMTKIYTYHSKVSITFPGLLLRAFIYQKLTANSTDDQLIRLEEINRVYQSEHIQYKSVVVLGLLYYRMLMLLDRYARLVGLIVIEQQTESGM